MSHTPRHTKENTNSPIVAVMVIVFIVAAAVVYIFSDVPQAALNSDVSTRSEISGERVDTASRGIVYLGGVPINVELARTSESRERGLSGREYLGENAGMLFVFSTDDHYGFWMKDMNFPLDIVWLDESFTVVDVAESVSPDSFPNIFLPVIEARYVLEIREGLFSKLGARVGDSARFERVK